MLTERKALYPGTFDPITKGHEAIIARGLKLFDMLIIAVSESGGKSPLFSLEERLDMVRTIFRAEKRIEVIPFRGLLVDVAQKEGACAVVKGIRNVSDLEYEEQMAQMNHHLNKNIETVFLFPHQEHAFISSGLLKEVASLGGDVSQMVSSEVYEALRRKLAKE